MLVKSLDEAESGKVALELVQKNKYDVIFMDHMMPEMDGIETFNHMKGMGDYLNAKTPVVVLTANAISGAKDEYLAEGFCDYLKKPVDADKLENLLAGLIPEEKKHVVSVADTAKDIVSVGDELPYIEAIDWAHALMKLGDEKLLRVLVSDFSAMSLNDIKVLNEMFLELQSGKKEAFDAFYFHKG